MRIFQFCKTTRQDGQFKHTFRTMEELAEVLEGVVNDADEVEHVRWQGIPNALSADAPIPYAEELAVDVSRHFHDGVPKILLYALRETEADDMNGHHKAQYLYGLIYDPANGTSDWEDAWSLAGRIRGRLDPSAPKHKHPNWGGKTEEDSRDLIEKLRERMVPHIKKVCREGPSDAAKGRAQKALRLLREGKGGQREYDSLFEQGPSKDDATVAALWWLYRTDERAKETLDAHEGTVPQLVFEAFTEARPAGLFEDKSGVAKGG